MKTNAVTAEKKVPELTPDDYARIADAIHRISDAGKKMKAAGLGERAILVLLQDYTNLPRRDIALVVDAIPKLAAFYLSKAAGK